MQTQLFINGRFVPAQRGESLPVINPHDGSGIANVAMGEGADIDAAVDAARAALPAWRQCSAIERGRLLLKLADAVERHGDELARLESLNSGHPLRDTLSLDVPRTVGVLRYFGGMADKFEGSVIPVESGFLNYVLRDPVGVVGQIVPWNFPLMFTSWKLGPALAAGNCLVMKPSELTPLTTLRVAELSAQVGFPPGVINVVPGLGAVAGQRLAEHPEIAKIAFTGSTRIGREIVAASAGNLKRVQLELGGKGANIVFSDADLPAAVNGAALAIFQNQGQACIAGSRLILQRAIADEFLERFLELARSIRLGDPLDPSTEMGPLTSAMHRDRVLEYVRISKEQGGELLMGGQAPAQPALARGFYVEPTVVAAKPTDRVCQEEVFGPFVTVSLFQHDEEALLMANATEFGLGGGLWTRDLRRAHQFARGMKCGMVWVNCYKRGSPGSPFGGTGSSGYGRELGFDAMREYTQPRSVWINVDAQVPSFYPR